MSRVLLEDISGLDYNVGYLAQSASEGGLACVIVYGRETSKSFNNVSLTLLQIGRCCDQAHIFQREISGFKEYFRGSFKEEILWANCKIMVLWMIMKNYRQPFLTLKKGRRLTLFLSPDNPGQNHLVLRTDGFGVLVGGSRKGYHIVSDF